MMDLDEAIQHCEEVVEEQEKLYRLCPASESGLYHCDGSKDCITLKNGKNKGCQKCASEHRQLAEWLKELKDYRKTWDEIKKQIKEESNFAYADFDKYKYEVLGVDDIDELPDDDFRYGMERAIEIINEYIRVVKE